jgi:hypothetical protein
LAIRGTFSPEDAFLDLLATGKQASTSWQQAGGSTVSVAGQSCSRAVARRLVTLHPAMLTREDYCMPPGLWTCILTKLLAWRGVACHGCTAGAELGEGKEEGSSGSGGGGSCCSEAEGDEGDEKEGQDIEEEVVEGRPSSGLAGGGHCHSGMGCAALFLGRKFGPVLRPLHNQGCSITLVGHSLGAGEQYGRLSSCTVSCCRAGGQAAARALGSIAAAAAVPGGRIPASIATPALAPLGLAALPLSSCRRGQPADCLPAAQLRAGAGAADLLRL